MGTCNTYQNTDLAPVEPWEKMKTISGKQKKRNNAGFITRVSYSKLNSHHPSFKLLLMFYSTIQIEKRD